MQSMHLVNSELLVPSDRFCRCKGGNECLMVYKFTLFAYHFKWNVSESYLFAVS